MRQEATPLPPSIPAYQPGHRPQLITTRGAPHRYRIGGPAPTTFHIERCRCSKATAPSTSRALTEGRWTEPTGQHRIPLSHLSRTLFAHLATAAQGRTLRRTRGGFAAMPVQMQTSGTVQIQAFTRRCINWLDNAGLVQLDDPQFSNTITLNQRGGAYAE